MKPSLKIAAIVAAASVGDGVFALPFVFYMSGWLTGIFYLVILAGMIILAHATYLETLEKVGEKERLLGLARLYLGEWGFWVGFLAIVIGLLLTLVAYLVLGAQFIHLAVPSAEFTLAFGIFWAFISLPMFLNDHSFVELELVGITCTSLIILIIFFSAWPDLAFNGVPAVNPKYLFLPFGAVLFSLAGWTAIEPAYETRKKVRHAASRNIPWRGLVLGTFFAAALYVMFAAGIIGSAPQIAADTASGLTAWPLWKKEMLSILGLVAVGTVYLPISREIKNSLEKDLGWSKFSARSIIILLPMALIGLGFNNFLSIIGLVGGVFVGLQYLLIVSVGRRALAHGPLRRWLLDIVAFVFVIAAVYEVWTFVVH